MTAEVPKSIRNLEDVLNLPVDENIFKPTTDVETIASDNSQSDFDNDYQIARSTIKNMINRSDELIDNLTMLASSTENPRCYEVATLAIKNTSEMALNLLKLHDQKNKKQIDKSDVGQPVQNNIVFSGSPVDLLSEMKMNFNQNKEL